MLARVGIDAMPLVTNERDRVAVARVIDAIEDAVERLVGDDAEARRAPS